MRCSLLRLTVFLLIVGTIFYLLGANLNGGHSGKGRKCSCVHPAAVIELKDPPEHCTEVAELQLGLRRLNFYHGNLTGVYDKATEAAVKKFQAFKNMKINGVVDNKIWDALFASYEKDVNTSGKRLQPAKIKGQLSVVVDLERCSLTLYANGKELKRYPVAVGAADTPSPVGEWKIIEKAKDWGTGFGTRWLGLNVPWGLYGIHGTDKPYSVGYRMSHGCIRMFNSDVEELYRIVPIGTPVKIVGRIHKLANPRPIMKLGDSGQDVAYLQLLLKKMGFDPGTADGQFGLGTKQAVQEFQRFYGFVQDGKVDSNIYLILGLR